MAPRGRLLEAGFPCRLAERLAATPGVDLHALLDLVNRGCSPELADRILAPIADPEPPAVTAQRPVPVRPQARGAEPALRLDRRP